MPIELDIDDAEFRARVTAAFRGFAANVDGLGRQPGAHRARAGEQRPVPASAISRVAIGLDATTDIWRDASAEPRASQRGDELLVEHRDFVARLGVDAQSMAVLQPRRIISTENALRVLLALGLARRGGLLLHAAGVVQHGCATVLFGRSGSGKSTAARLARGRPVLGDDLVALTRVPDGWLAHSAPFGGRLGRRRRARAAPLRSLLRLHHGTSFRLSPLRPVVAAAELLQSIVLPAARDVDRAAALGLCSLLVQDILVQELRFPVDHALWRWLGERGL